MLADGALTPPTQIWMRSQILAQIIRRHVRRRAADVVDFLALSVDGLVELVQVELGTPDLASAGLPKPLFKFNPAAIVHDDRLDVRLPALGIDPGVLAPIRELRQHETDRGQVLAEGLSLGLLGVLVPRHKPHNGDHK